MIVDAVNAGRTDGSMDAANLLKPALARASETAPFCPANELDSRRGASPRPPHSHGPMHFRRGAALPRRDHSGGVPTPHRERRGVCQEVPGGA